MDDFVNEVWKVIDGFGHYEVSNCGRVRNTYTGRIRKPSINAYGYPYVSVKMSKKSYALRIHRLVAAAFLEPSTKYKAQINHIDGVKTNNTASNLEWVTPSENIRHAYETGLNHGRVVRQSTTNAASGVKGVTFHRGKWRAVICVKGKKVYLGRFTTPELASEAYKTAEKFYFAEVG